MPALIGIRDSEPTLAWVTSLGDAININSSWHAKHVIKWQGYSQQYIIATIKNSIRPVASRIFC